ncbi:hypothetical protein [Hymenobacter sp. UYP22]|uniref:hypothetical protein n=1 Tax=Hymenobacter sp. UYP22 TaxID=3156348 RepID=UPI003392C549
MELTSLDFQQARIKQVLFKSRLRSVLYGVRDADEALFSVRDNPLGQWIETVIKPQYNNASLIRELERILSDTLQTGRQLVGMHQRGQLEEARKGLEQIEAHGTRMEEVLQKMEQSLR